MRISDWSSDVCSSDLKPDKADGGSISCRRFLEREGREGGNAAIVYRDRLRGNRSGVPEIPSGGKLRRLGPPWQTRSNGRAHDRKSVVSGKSVSVRVDLGGPGIIQTNTTKTRQKKK